MSTSEDISTRAPASQASVQAKAATGMFGWLREGTPEARQALWGASLGWALDGFDVMLYALVITALIPALNLSKATAGLIGSVTLVTSGIGGVGFGFLADRFGRRLTMMASILMYSIFTFCCGLATSMTMLLVFRGLLGLGMGGEWTSGAALVSESWSTEHRGKALALRQSAWAIGYGAAALVAAIVLPRWGWRTVFFVGILPAFVALFVQYRVKESEVWKANRDKKIESKDKVSFSSVFTGHLGRMTLVITLLSVCAMFAYWGLNLWVPAYLSLPVSKGGIGLGGGWPTTLIILMNAGMFLGYFAFGYFADYFGRKRTFLGYMLLAAVFIFLYISTRNPWLIVFLGPLVGFFGTGIFSGFGPITAEIYPTSVRATAQGFTFNMGRLASGAAPFIVGTLADKHGLASGFVLTAAALLLGCCMFFWIPETRGRNLT